MRAFVAIELSPELKKVLSSVQEALREHLNEGTVGWTRPEGVHLTLKFLGEVARHRIPEIGSGIETAVQGTTPFHLTLDGLGGFPSGRSPRVIWVGVLEPTGSLARLQSRIEGELESLGFPRENRAFSPHLTLGRIRGGGAEPRRLLGRALEASALSPEGGMEVRMISLMRSQLRPAGAEYTRLAHSELQGP